MILTGDCRTEMRKLISEGVKVQMCVTFLLTLLRYGVTTMKTKGDSL